MLTFLELCISEAFSLVKLGFSLFFFSGGCGILSGKVFVDSHFCINTHHCPRRSTHMGPSVEQGMGSTWPTQGTCAQHRARGRKNTDRVIGHQLLLRTNF